MPHWALGPKRGNSVPIRLTKGIADFIHFPAAGPTPDPPRYPWLNPNCFTVTYGLFQQTANPGESPGRIIGGTPYQPISCNTNHRDPTSRSAPKGLRHSLRALREPLIRLSFKLNVTTCHAPNTFRNLTSPRAHAGLLIRHRSNWHRKSGLIRVGLFSHALPNDLTTLGVETPVGRILTNQADQKLRNLPSCCINAANSSTEVSPTCGQTKDHPMPTPRTLLQGLYLIQSVRRNWFTIEATLDCKRADSPNFLKSCSRISRTSNNPSIEQLFA